MHRALSLVSSFERTPQPDETIFEASDPSRLALTRDGGLASTHSNQPGFLYSKPAVLKKCRNYAAFAPAGEVCTASLYQLESSLEASHMEVLIQMLIETSGEPENSPVLRPQGLTGLWVSHQVGAFVLLYKLTARSSEDAIPTFETRTLANRLNADSYQRLLKRLREESALAGFQIETW